MLETVLPEHLDNFNLPIGLSKEYPKAEKVLLTSLVRSIKRKSNSDKTARSRCIAGNFTAHATFFLRNRLFCTEDLNLLLNFSAGVGRTGVFITLSIVLECMQYEGVVDIFQTVRILRTQRPAMVQTEVRFFFFLLF